MSIQRVLGIVAVVCGVAALIVFGSLGFKVDHLLAYGVIASGVAIAL